MPVLLAVVAAASLWVPLLRQAERSVFARVPVLDEVWYLDRAAALDGLAAPRGEPTFMSPLYPVLIKLAGSGQPVPDDRVVPAAQLRGLRLLQIACWAGTVLLLRLLAGRLLPAGAPRRSWLVWLPPLLFVFYRPAAVYALAVLLELPLVFLLTLALWLLVLLPRSRRPLVVAAAAGLALG
ncbi:MAG: phospholipid carrier-dependent glycosyltransferase, partial [Krumholzibacteria bacterium]|nr:phospholipid carrier-dependent glycosyltransferase [Candidatus Krumholzibacteria bacterium]